MEYVIKLGADRCTDAMRTNIYKIRKLSNFCYNEKGTDQGKSGKLVLLFLTDF
jgi:hypothetical protein